MNLFYTNINEFNTLDGIELLSSERIDRIRNLKRIEDKKRLLVSGLLINYSLGDKAKDIQKNDFGKLYLNDNSAYFNITHSADYVCLITDNKDIGIDIERKETLSDFDTFLNDFTKVFFTRSEADYIKNYKDDLYKIITIKESILKALGYGLSIDPKLINVVNNNQIVDRINVLDRILFLKSLEIDDYVISIASITNNSLSIKNIHKNELLK